MKRRHQEWTDRMLSRATRGRIVSVGLPVILLLTGTFIVFMNLRRGEQARLSTAFQSQSATVYNGLSSNFDVYLETVEAIASFHAATGSIKRRPFHAFVNRTVNRYDGIQALEWIPRVRQSERAAIEETTRNEGLADFRFKKWTPGEEPQWVASDSEWSNEYFPALLVEPSQGNEPAIGIDLGSNPTRREALQRARDSGQAVATARVTLAQDDVEQAGFLILIPVYAARASAESINERRENLAGFAVGVFRVSNIVNQVLADLDMGGIQIRITDQTAENDDRLLFDNSSPQSATSGTVIEMGYTTGLTTSFLHEVGGRHWQIEFTATPQYIESHSHWNSWLILAGGILSSLLLGAVLHLVLGRASEVEKLVDLQTERLREANTKLEQEIRERELAKRELQTKAVELEKSNEHLKRFNRSATGREMRMIELKQEINALLESSGQPARYNVSFMEK